MWRGPKKNSIIKQFVENVSWGDLNILIVDTPPGTSDEHLRFGFLLDSSWHPTYTVCSVIESLAGLALDGAVLVTTPQGVALNDVRKEHSFCVKLGIPVIGLVENMSGYTCRCGTVTHIFQCGGGRELAVALQCPLLASIPIDAR
jgi:Mrp family chromosome partitioning ATPase